MPPLPVAGPYSYAVPDGMAVTPGSVVQVPVGPRKVIGIVWEEAGDAVDPKKLRPIEPLAPSRRQPRSHRDRSADRRE